MKNNTIAIGVDIGGTHITCASVDLAAEKILPDTLSRVAYSHESAADLIFRAWAKALNRTLKHTDASRLAGIGFAVPGPFDYRNGLSRMRHKFAQLYGLHIPTALNPLLTAGKDLPMRFLNDATAFGAGEAWLGQGRGFDKVVVVTLGTGFGSAFLNRGVPVVSGPTVPEAGCLWHLPFRDGIADDYFSTRWLVGEYERLQGEKTAGGVREMLEKAGESPVIQAIFRQFGHNLGECLAPWLQKFRAGILIVGGNIAHAMPLFENAFRETLETQDLRVPARTSGLMEKAALFGSARLLDDGFWKKVSAHLPQI